MFIESKMFYHWSSATKSIFRYSIPFYFLTCSSSAPTVCWLLHILLSVVSDLFHQILIHLFHDNLSFLDVIGLWNFLLKHSIHGERHQLRPVIHFVTGIFYTCKSVPNQGTAAWKPKLDFFQPTGAFCHKKCSAQAGALISPEIRIGLDS